MFLLLDASAGGDAEQVDAALRTALASAVIYHAAREMERRGRLLLG
ncbi:MAG TPA: hypothetical protein VGQ71_10165 [Terriglobales bacterium]|nr:hypothetical protein [Terriglobales bacterium]